MDSLPFIVFSCILFHSNLQLYPVATFDYQRITMDPNFPEISQPSKRPSAAAFPSEPAPADSGRARSIHKTGRQDELQTGVGQGLELLGASTSKNVFLLHVKVTVISPSPKNWFKHWKYWNYLTSKRMSFLEYPQNGSNPVDGHPSVGWSTKWPVAPKSETGSNVAQVKQAGTLFFDGLFLPTWRSWVSPRNQDALQESARDVTGIGGISTCLWGCVGRVNNSCQSTSMPVFGSPVGLHQLETQDWYPRSIRNQT